MEVIHLSWIGLSNKLQSKNKAPEKVLSGTEYCFEQYRIADTLNHAVRVRTILKSQLSYKDNTDLNKT